MWLEVATELLSWMIFGREMPTESNTTLLIVDDEEEFRGILSTYFVKRGYEVHVAAGLREALLHCNTILPDVAIVDCLLPDGNGLDLISVLKNQNNKTSIFVLTGHGSIDFAVRAIKQGAEQFLTKPVDLKVLASQVEKAVENQRAHRFRTANVANRAQWQRNPFLGRSVALQRLENEVQKILASDLPVLIEGETGSGKGVLAGWLHSNGPRSSEAFVDVNCAGLSKELLESELFGHEKGSFTGAVAAKPGLLESAHHGTAFLDEIGDMDLAIQPKLLKVVEEKTFRHVGGIRDRILDTRLIAATHCDLMNMVREKTFRSDLYFRINTIPIRIPSLRSRPEDVPLLAQFFIERLRSDLGYANLDLSRSALKSLESYKWPGNIRELRNVLERAALVAGDTVIDDIHLLLRYDKQPEVQFDNFWHLSMEKLEAMHIERVLEQTSWSVNQAAEKLGIAKSTLYAKIRHHQIAVGVPN
jgi:DNA-binding NtrC family response regulator